VDSTDNHAYYHVNKILAMSLILRGEFNFRNEAKILYLAK